MLNRALCNSARVFKQQRCPLNRCHNLQLRHCRIQWCHSSDPWSSTEKQGRPVPCRAQIWWIRAVPNISVPCPHDPVPCQIFPCRALMIRAQIWWIRAKKYGALFCRKKKGACGNVPTSQGLPKRWGPFLPKKKAPAATYPQAKGFQKFAPLGIQAEKQGFRTAWLITGQKFP